ncbi:MAG: Rpn family recombination-promoting nuclease/putative transposase [Kiritimatiellae bacterium]|nr:Rpn family recombination-promoting nuclease/putative transposase [Kiritimatiellia bacterium]
MAKYLDPKADVTFKKVFGEHKNLVISLLNALLPLDDGKKVESIEYLPPEMVPRTPITKNTSVDVRCEETGGRKFIVEMQMEWTTAFKQRVLLNASKAYVRQLEKGDEYELLQPVYSLNLVNATFEPDMEEYYHYYRLVHYLHSDRVLEGLHLVFVELPKFRAKNLTEKKMQVLWLRFLTEIGHDGADEVSQDLLDNPQTGQALEIVRESAYSPAEMDAYDRFWDIVSSRRSIAADMERRLGAAKAELDALVVELDATKSKLDATKSKLDATKSKLDATTSKLDATTSKLDATVEKLRESARQMKTDGMAVETIAKYTGLTAAEIARL